VVELQEKACCRQRGMTNDGGQGHWSTRGKDDDDGEHQRPPWVYLRDTRHLDGAHSEVKQLGKLARDLLILALNCSGI
jgi:hypothetical protein